LTNEIGLIAENILLLDLRNEGLWVSQILSLHATWQFGKKKHLGI
jgi:hypothetical protein